MGAKGRGPRSYVGKGEDCPQSVVLETNLKEKIGTQFVFLAGKKLKYMKSIHILGPVPLPPIRGTLLAVTLTFRNFPVSSQPKKF